MNVQTEVAPKPKPPEAVEHHRLESASFHQALTLWAETSVSTAKGYTIVPARLTAALDWRECKGDEAPTGLGLTKVAKTAQGGRVVRRCYVPMSNVSELGYGE